MNSGILYSFKHKIWGGKYEHKEQVTIEKCNELQFDLLVYKTNLGPAEQDHFSSILHSY